MPDVNLLKDTQSPQLPPKKPVRPTEPELTDPRAASGAGLGGIFKSLFNRGPKSLPSVTPPVGAGSGGRMSVGRAGTTERILSETKREAPSVIPLPEDDETSYNVNLLTEDLVTSVDPKKRAALLGVITLGSLIVVGLAYGGLLAYQSSIKKDITDAEQNLTRVRGDIDTEQTTQLEAANTVAKVSALQSLIDRHTRWTKFFALLEKYTLKDVTYGSSFNADTVGVVTLTATTTSYEKVAKQYLIFDQLVRDGVFIGSFDITGATSTPGKEEGSTDVKFVITLTLLPSNFTLSRAEYEALLKAPAPQVEAITPTTEPLTPIEP